MCVGGGGSCNITSNDCITSCNMLSRPPGLGDWTDGELCLKLLLFFEQQLYDSIPCRQWVPHYTGRPVSPVGHV